MNAKAIAHFIDYCLCNYSTSPAHIKQTIAGPSMGHVTFMPQLFGKLLRGFARIASSAHSAKVKLCACIGIKHKHSGLEISPSATVASVDGIVKVFGGKIAESHGSEEMVDLSAR